MTDPALAETITTSLNEAGFDGAEADTAEAGTATLILEETPVVEADLPLSNVSVEDANEPAFQEALIEAVAERLNVDADDVTITAVTAADDDEADVVVTYQVAEVDVMDQMETEKVRCKGREKHRGRGAGAEIAYFSSRSLPYSSRSLTPLAALRLFLPDLGGGERGARERHREQPGGGWLPRRRR